MIKATGKGPKGNDTLFIGLSFDNLDKFRAGPCDSYILIDGKEHGLSHDIMIFSGRTEAEMTDMVAGGIGPDTIVHISSKLKS